MDWTQFVLFVVAMAGLDFLSSRSTKEDIKLTKEEIKSIRAENSATVNAIRQEISSNHNAIVNLILAIKDEMKQFHGRLCALEENSKVKGG